ncbi:MULTISPECIES: transglutaminase family protein [unclassified Saccharicrinis]|uniref:transglutaminase family protein n=1 Tax=unclassified Saccharicrinis TaxID=2646859 RepID=UPI003D343B1D
MAIKVAIRHNTYYKYDRLVSASPHVIRLRPAPHSRTRIHSYSLNISPKEHFINWQQDAFGNYLARVVFKDKLKELKVEVEVIAEMTVVNPFDFFVEEYAQTFPFAYQKVEKKELTPYFEIVESGPLLMKWLKKIKNIKNDKIVEFLRDVNQMLYDDLDYTIRLETGVYTCEETLEKKKGSCRDFAWLMVQIMRHLGIASRFVSGYLVQLKSDEKSIDGPSGPEEDFTDLHAWCEVYIPGAGWIGLDATSGLFAGEEHIPLCCTPDYGSASPITGATDKCEVEFSFVNDVKRIHEDPRVTKPFSDQQWINIMALGDQVEREFEEGDVRLTMGGEPTFVSMDDMESPQWNTDADGKEKRELAYQLLHKLSEKIGYGTLHQYGQGKWYPGEPTPRWQMSLYWRKDDKPIWKNKKLFADVSQKHHYTNADVENFIKVLATKLGVEKNNAMPAYEDAFYYLWEERNLPKNIDPLNINLNDSLERRSMMEQLDRGLNKAVAFVLPLEWAYQKKNWISCAWEFNGRKLLLIPGNSQVGHRLPLNSLPYMAEARRQKPYERSPFEEVDELPDYHQLVDQRSKEEADYSIPDELLYPPKIKHNAEEEEENLLEKFMPFSTKKEKKDDYEPLYDTFTIRKALVTELRDGRLHIFIPPTDLIEHYLDLLAAIELTAEELKMKVVIEGYNPPYDNRIDKLMVTPDPGVIEVNINPSKNWNELVSNYNMLFECARECRLGAEKFMLDGKHTGTGGGNHITLGGIKPADSPLLRRPDILRSFITFWQHHPGLSYLFSTSFVGPTSQAPRVDEGRQEMLYELEIAFDQIPNPGEKEIPFYLIDRTLRNLLIDLTGNTHRAEFCIDKLYSPDSMSGRLGILELRAFDMPPNKQMCLMQLLLIRTLFAWFWKKPYKGKLVRWGTALHDKFLTHHFVKEDLKDVVSQLNDAGYHFDIEWLEPFFEFRFAHIGRINYEHIELSLRSGIEPWNVLGEEMSSSGTARFVDSSVERVEIKVEGLNDERHKVLCNQMQVPLVKTGKAGEYVASIRYRAWQPPSALHPNLGVDTPLVFDIFDTWTGKAVAGCTYHVYHPGGRAYETFPVNSYDAEGRRVSRFYEGNHTQGMYQPEYPDFNMYKNTSHTPGKISFIQGDIQRYITPGTTDNVSTVAFVPTNIESDPEYPCTFDIRKQKLKKLK